MNTREKADLKKKNEELLTLYAESNKTDISIRNKIIENNLDLVNFVLNKFKGIENIEDDLKQTGYIALLLAVEHFDVSTSFEFSTYATKCIYQKMGAELERLKNNGRTMPSNFFYTIKPIIKFVAAYTLLHHEPPSRDEIFENTHCSDYAYDLYLNLPYYTSDFSLDQKRIGSNLPSDSIENDTFLDIVQGEISGFSIDSIEKSVCNDKLYDTLKFVLRRIPYGYDILKRQYGIDDIPYPMSGKEIANELNLPYDFVKSKMCIIKYRLSVEKERGVFDELFQIYDIF